MVEISRRYPARIPAPGHAQRPVVTQNGHLAFVSRKFVEELIEAPRPDGQFGWCLR
jgi:hypothetical protein